MRFDLLPLWELLKYSLASGLRARSPGRVAGLKDGCAEGEQVEKD